MEKAFVFQCPIKIQEHTNSDGSKILIRSIEIKERSFWDELTDEWIKAEKAQQKPQLVQYSIPDNQIHLRIICDPVTLKELYREYWQVGLKRRYSSIIYIQSHEDYLKMLNGR